MLLKPQKVLVPALGLALALQGASCKKDESKTDLLVGEWELVEIDGNDPGNFGLKLRFDEDKDFRVCSEYSGYSECYHGTWDWANSQKDEVEMEYEDDFGDDYHLHFSIDKLTKDELEGELESDGDTYDVVFEKID